jgi:SAM-dependent methyltransferase
MERLSVLKSDRPTDGTYLEHYFRYRFADRFVRDMLVLDCACGTGYGTFILAERSKEVVGVDRDSGALAIAKTNWAAGNIQYVQLDVKDLDRIGRSFEVIVSFETIEHIEDPRTFLRLACESLSPGGILIVSTPNREVYRRRLAPNPFHIQEFSRDELQAILPERLDRIRWFGQLEYRLEYGNDEETGRPSAFPGLAMLRARAGDRIASTTLGRSIYLRRMQRRFGVVETEDPGAFVYIIAVCRKS